MHYAVLVIPLLVIGLLPVAFAQTDFDETSNGTDSQFEDIVEQEVVETGVFKTYDNILNEDGSYTMSTHYPYFELESGEFVPYRLVENDSMVQIEIDGGKFVFDKEFGALTIFDSDGIVIDSDSYVVRQAQLNSDDWTNLTVNDESIVTTVEEKENNVVVVSFIRENFEGLFTVEYVINSGSLKTTAYFTNNFFESSKFAFTETIELPDSIISVNDMQDIDLSNFVGQTFPREVLEQNEDLVLEIKDSHYNSGIGFDNLWAVTILENNKVALDYANVEQTQTAIGETVELDPTIVISTSLTVGYLHYTGSSFQASYTGAPPAGAGSMLYVHASNTNWYYPYQQLDLQSIPNTATVTSASIFTPYTSGWGDSHSNIALYSGNPHYLEWYRSYQYGAPTYVTAVQNSQTFTINSNGISDIQQGVSNTSASNSHVTFSIGYDKGGGYPASPITTVGSGVYYSQWQLTVNYTVPAVPDNITPTASTSGGQNTVTWSQPNNNGATIDQYDIYGNGVYLHSINNSPTTTTWTHTNPTLGTSIYYQVYPHNSVGWQIVAPNSNSVTPSTVPDVPSAPTATFVSNTSNTVTWTLPNDNGATIDQVLLYRGGLYLGDMIGSTSYTDTGITVGTSNNYKINVHNTNGYSGESSLSNTILNANAPDAPTGLTAVTGAPITMTWIAPSSDMTITNYKIYRDGTLIQTLGVAGNFSDNTVVGGTTYSYEVSAVSSAGEGNKSSSSSTVAGLPADPPSLGLTHNSANLNINVAITDGNSMGTGTLTNYTVERSADGSTGWTSVGTPNSSPFVDTVPSAGTWYYRANTITNHGTSGYSNIVNIAHVAPDAPSITSASYNNPANSNIEVAITNGASFGTGDFTNYTIERSADGSTNWISAGTATSSPFIDTNVPSVGDWYYRVATNTPHGTSAFSSNGQASPVAPDTPTGITSTISNPNPSPLTVSVGWTAPGNFGTGNLTGYEVYRDGTLITTTGTSTGYDDTVPNAGTFVYTIKTVTAHATSVLSVSTSITTPTVPVSDSSVSLSIDNPNPNPLDITVSFVAPSSNGGSAVLTYDLHSSSDNITFNQIATGVTADQTVTVSSAGTWYFKSLSTNNVGSSGLGSAVSIATPSIPTSDSSVTLSIDNPNPNPLDITVSFVAPSSNGGSSVTGYNLSSSPDDITYTQIASAVTADQTVTVSSAGTWYFKSQAINNIGTATLGSAVSIATPTVPGIPSLTLSIVDPNASPFDITSSFTTPSSNGGSAVTGYNLYYSSDNITYSSIASAVTADQLKVVSGIGTHYFKAEAINNVGTGSLSSAFSIATPSLPTAVSDLAVSSVTDTTIGLTWTEPANGGSNIIDYTVYRDGSSIGTTTTVGYADSGLTTQTSYVYTVYARSNAGTSLVSNSTTQVTQGVPAVVPSFQTTTASLEAITLSWTAPNDFGSTITGYLIERESPTGNGFVTVTTTGVVTTYSDTGLTPVTQYNYRISAINSYGNGATTTSSTTTLPAPPTNIMVTPSSSTSELVVTWSAPADTTGMTGYQIYRENGIGNGFTLINTTTTLGTTFTDTGLSINTFYNYKLKSVTPQGNSAYSNTYAQTTFNLPDPVTVLTATAGTVADVTLDWDAPTNPYAAIIGYTIYKVDAPGTTATATATLSTTLDQVSSITITDGGLQYSVVPTVTVSAPTGQLPHVTATATAAITNGVVTSITVTNNGDGYNTIPTVTLTSPSINTSVSPTTTLTPFIIDTGDATTSRTITGLEPAGTHNFAIAPITIHGSSILNAAIVSTSPDVSFEGIVIDMPDDINPNQNDIIFMKTQVGNNTNLTLEYDAALDITCETSNPFSATTNTYPNLAETSLGNGKVIHTIAFNDSQNNIVDVMCYDVNDPTIKGQQRIQQNIIPLKEQMDDFNSNTFGTGSSFAAIDLMTLIVVIVGMIGFNRKNPAVGLALMAGLIGILSYFQVITLETSVISGFTLVVFLAIAMGLKRS